MVTPFTEQGEPSDPEPWTPPAHDLMLFQSWLQALRREHSVAHDMAQILTPPLVAAYIERFLLTDQAPSHEVLETALAAQGPDLVRHLRTWLRRRPIPPRRAPTALPMPLTGNQVRQARLTQGWSQQELARRVGKSQPWVALVEQGKRTMQPQEHATLRTLLNLEPESPAS